MYKDKIVLPAVGLLAGTGIGVGLAYMIIWFLEMEAIRYVRDANAKVSLSDRFGVCFHRESDGTPPD